MMRTLLFSLPLLLFLLFWYFMVAGDVRAQFLFASPALVGNIALTEITTLSLWQDVGYTALAAVLGLVSGTLLGTVLGLLLWTYRKFDWLVHPYLVVIGSIPVFAIAPMLVVWFGTGLLAKVVMAGFAVLFVALTQAYEGAVAIERQYVGTVKALRAPTLRLVRFIIIPGAFDWVLTGFKLNVGLALVGAFIGEFVSSDMGLGHYILRAGALYDVPRVIFGIIMISVLALLFTAAAWIVQKKWRH